MYSWEGLSRYTPCTPEGLGDGFCIWYSLGCVWGRVCGQTQTQTHFETELCSTRLGEGTHLPLPGGCPHLPWGPGPYYSCRNHKKVKK
jgi:hypothetical protein